jgi:hypothetical protein
MIANYLSNKVADSKSLITELRFKNQSYQANTNTLVDNGNNRETVTNNGQYTFVADRFTKPYRAIHLNGTIPTIPDDSEPGNTTTGGYDLTVYSIKWSPVYPQIGQPVTFSVTLKNIGDTATPSGIKHGVVWSISQGNPITAFLTNVWSDTDYNSLPAGGKINLTANGGTTAATWTPTANGVYTIVAFCNDQNDLPNEVGGNGAANNKHTIVLTIGTTAPDPNYGYVAGTATIIASQITNQFTVNFMINRDRLVDGEKIIDTGKFNIVLNSTNIQLTIGTTVNTFSYVLPISTYCLLSFTYDSTNVKLYVNGVFNSQVSCTTAMGTTTTYSVGGSFIGKIDYYSLYSIAKVAMQIKNIYSELQTNKLL